MAPTPPSNRDAALFRNAFHYAPIGMALVGLDGRFMLANSPAFTMLGYTEEELYEESYANLTHPDDLEQDNEYVQQLLRHEIDSYQMEKRYIHKSGEIIHALLTVSLVHDEDGNPLHFIAQLVDITESVRIKQQLNHLHRRISTTLASISDAFYTIDHEYKFIYVNTAATALFRLAEHELIGRIMWEVFPSLIGKTSHKQLAFAFSSNQPVQFEEYIIAYNQWFEAKAYPSEFGLSIHFHDITERKRTADKLHESEKSFRLLAENSSDMISKHRPDGVITYVSPACFPLLGYLAIEIIGRSIYTLCHPDDKERMRESMKLLNFEQLDTQTISYRLMRKDGAFRWFETTSNRVYHDDDRSFTIVAVTRDITPRKEIELKMLEQYQLMHELSHIDELTRIANRRAFDEAWKQEWDDAHSHEMPLTLMLCDIDDFKKYNDHFGHQQGDECLRTIAAIMRKTLKRPIDFVARYGGEEFAIILPQTGEERAASIAALLLKAIQRKQITHADTCESSFVTISLGMATWKPGSPIPQNALFELADQALYRAKREGKNRYASAIDKP